MFEDNLHGGVATGSLQLGDILGAALVVAAQELAYGHHDINLGSTVFYGEGGLGNLYLDEGL